MEQGRRKTNGMNLLASLLINIIVFTLAFVYITAGDIYSSSADGETSGVRSISDDLNLLTGEGIGTINPPADFLETDAGVEAGINDRIEIPDFPWIFDSYLLPPPYRGGEYYVSVRLDIGADGELVSEPVLLTSSGEKWVDDETLKRLKEKVKFAPAANKETGEKIRAKMDAFIAWSPGGG